MKTNNSFPIVQLMRMFMSMRIITLWLMIMSAAIFDFHLNGGMTYPEIMFQHMSDLLQDFLAFANALLGDQNMATATNQA